MLTAAAGSRTGDAQVRTGGPSASECYDGGAGGNKGTGEGRMTGLLNIAGWRYGEAGM